MLIEGLALIANADRLSTGESSGVTAGAVLLVGLQLAAIGFFSTVMAMAPRKMLDADPKAARRLSMIEILCGVVLAAEGTALVLLFALRSDATSYDFWPTILFTEIFTFGLVIVLMRLLRGRYDTTSSVSAAMFTALASLGLLAAGLGPRLSFGGEGALPASTVVAGGMQFCALAVLAIVAIMLRDRPQLRKELCGYKLRDLFVTELAVILSLEGLLICGFAIDAAIIGLGNVTEGTMMQIGLIVAILGLVIPLLIYSEKKSDEAKIRLGLASALFVLVLVPFALFS